MNETSSPPESIPVTATSNVGPLWLVFNNNIFNTQNITNIERAPLGLFIYTIDGKLHQVEVSNEKEVWESLQKVFTVGVPSEP